MFVWRPADTFRWILSESQQHSGSISEVFQTFYCSFLWTNPLPAPHHSTGLLGQSVTWLQALIYLSEFTNPLQLTTSYYSRGWALTPTWETPASSLSSTISCPKRCRGQGKRSAASGDAASEKVRKHFINVVGSWKGAASWRLNWIPVKSRGCSSSASCSSLISLGPRLLSLCLVSSAPRSVTPRHPPCLLTVTAITLRGSCPLRGKNTTQL